MIQKCVSFFVKHQTVIIFTIILVFGKNTIFSFVSGCFCWGQEKSSEFLNCHESLFCCKEATADSKNLPLLHREKLLLVF
jgi:hypothetical protein